MRIWMPRSEQAFLVLRGVLELEAPFEGDYPVLFDEEHLVKITGLSTRRIRNTLRWLYVESYLTRRPGGYYHLTERGRKAANRGRA